MALVIKFYFLNVRGYRQDKRPILNIAVDHTVKVGEANKTCDSDLNN